MSGICGIVTFHGTDPTVTEIQAIVRPLERRGPDRTLHYLERNVALGHTLLATTPEALIETLPLTDAATGCTITADVRLDNREELLAALELSDATIGDGELILRAYLEWGESCLTHLLGDFAFAIWDARHRRLFCARDHMGMRQFNYCHVAGRLFAFATEDTALLEVDGVPTNVSEARVADFIGDLEGFDFQSTFFERIFRLPPAHSMTVAAGRCDVRRYWQLRPGSQLRLDTDEAYGAAFLELFTEAVRCRLRNTGKLGAMLSGGLDSSAVVAVAAGIRSASHDAPLKTFSAIAPDAAHCPETIAIQSALTIDGLDPTLISQADFNGQSAALIGELDQARNPFELNGTMLRCIYRTAREHGVNIVLDGGAGDVVLTSGNRIAALIAKGQIRRAIDEANGEVRFWKPANPASFRRRALISSAWVVFAPKWLRGLRRHALHAKPLGALKPEIAKKVGVARRRRLADEHVRIRVTSEAARRTQAMVHPNLTSGRERFDQLAATFGVECRDPFMDIRVLQFCLSLPPEQLQAGGWPKLILRRAIEHMVPHDIAWRRGKEHLGWDFTAALLATWSNWQDSMRDPASPLRDYLSPDAFRRLRDSPSGPPTTLTLQLFVLDRFLRRHDDR